MMESPDPNAPFEDLMHLFKMAGTPRCHFAAATFNLPIVHIDKVLRYIGSFFQIMFGVQIAGFLHNDYTVKYDWSMTIKELLNIFGVQKNDYDQPVITIIFAEDFNYQMPNGILPENVLKPFTQVVDFWRNNYLQPPSRAHVFTYAFQIYVARMSMKKDEQIILSTTFTAEGVLGYLEDIVSLAYPQVYSHPELDVEFWPNNSSTRLQLGKTPKALYSLGFRSQETEFEE